MIAAEGLATAIQTPRYKANYVSINQTEAADKIDIARNFYHSIPDAFVALGLKPDRPWQDAEHELAFYAPPNTSTLISQPASSAIRGGRKDIYFDEFAHIRDAVKLYKAALPAALRGNGRMTIISTPMGQSGLFYDIATDTDSYPGWSRHTVPWWESRYMVRPERYEEALALHALGKMYEMGSKQRVIEFGTDKLLALFNEFGGDLDGFKTEFEASFVDETESYFVWELIVKNVDTELSIWRDIPPGWEPAGQVTIGVDVGKDRDKSVFTVVEHDEEEHSTVRFVEATQDPYPKQSKRLIELAKRAHASRVTIDRGGPGNYFYDELKAANVQGIEGVAFTNAKNEKWATTFKGDLQKERVTLLNDTMLKRQIHGIRRTRTESGLFKFSGKGNGGDDYFWSLMLALYGEGRVPSRISRVG